MSGAGDKDYTQKTLLEYQVVYGISFTLLYVWAELKECWKWKEVEHPNFQAQRQEKNKRYKSSGSSSFNTAQSVKGNFNLDMAASSALSASANEEALARFMINDMQVLASRKTSKRHITGKRVWRSEGRS
ncbi:hypothetical protein Tco_0979221 [Tanacetum coccineum]